MQVLDSQRSNHGGQCKPLERRSERPIAVRGSPRRVLVLLACLMLLACARGRQVVISQAPQGHERPSAEEIEKCATTRNYEIASPPQYWPPGTFALRHAPERTAADIEASDRFTRNWYGSELCAMGEAPLAPPDRGATRIRFLWLRSFHPAIAVRLEHSGSGTELVAIKLAGGPDYAPGAVAKRVTRPLSPIEWRGVEALVQRSGFWHMPTETSPRGVDGSQWIVEISEPSRYHIVDRWSGGGVKTLGLHLLHLAGLGIQPVY